MKRNRFVWVLLATNSEYRWDDDLQDRGHGVYVSTDKGYILRLARAKVSSPRVTWHIVRVRYWRVRLLASGSDRSTLRYAKLLQPNVGKGGYCFERKNRLEWK